MNEQTPPAIDASERQQNESDNGDANVQSDSIAKRDIRLGPAWVILLLQAIALVLTVTPSINNGTRFGIMMLGPAICLLLYLVWLLAFSRLRWRDRFGILLAIFATGIVTGLLIDPSMGVSLWIYAIPLSMFLITGVLWLGRSWSPNRRACATYGAIVCAWAVFLPARMEGFDGSYWPEFRWRWQGPSPAAIQLAANSGSETADTEPETLTADENDWPGFRGPNRNGNVPQATIATNWVETPLTERWRIPIGPAWSSFAGVGDRLFTQEQRGDSEMVVCYDAESGEEIWRHADASQFSEVVSGPGPRATPTFSNGSLYTMGGRAILNCLDATTGRPLWRRDLMEDYDAPLPIWGFSASPIVVDDVVIVYAGAPQDHGLVALDPATGELRWHVDTAGMNYSSPQLVSLHARELVLLASIGKLIAVDPKTGELVWEYKHDGQRSMAIIQPRQIDGNSVIVPFGDGGGIARIDLDFDNNSWGVNERWTTKNLRPSFNDFVYHDGHLYGFNQHIFTCIDAETGDRCWKAGRYGFGQVILFQQQELLLVTTEQGELVLLEANPQQHIELARINAISGKTWNHPIVFRNRLVVRNGAEAVCYDLASSDN